MCLFLISEPSLQEVTQLVIMTDIQFRLNFRSNIWWQLSKCIFFLPSLFQHLMYSVDLKLHKISKCYVDNLYNECSRHSRVMYIYHIVKSGNIVFMRSQLIMLLFQKSNILLCEDPWQLPNIHAKYFFHCDQWWAIRASMSFFAGLNTIKINDLCSNIQKMY